MVLRRVLLALEIPLHVVIPDQGRRSRRLLGEKERVPGGEGGEAAGPIRPFDHQLTIGGRQKPSFCKIISRFL